MLLRRKVLLALAGVVVVGGVFAVDSARFGRGAIAEDVPSRDGWGQVRDLAPMLEGRPKTSAGGPTGAPAPGQIDYSLREWREKLGLGVVTIRIEGLRAIKAIDPVPPLRITYDPSGLTFECVAIRNIQEGDAELPGLDPTVQIVSPGSQVPQGGISIRASRAELQRVAPWGVTRTSTQVFRSQQVISFLEEVLSPEDALVRVLIEGSEVFRRRAVVEPAIAAFKPNAQDGAPLGSVRFKLVVNRVIAKRMNTDARDMLGREVPISNVRLSAGDVSFDPRSLPDAPLEDLRMEVMFDHSPKDALSEVIVTFERIDGAVVRAHYKY